MFWSKRKELRKFDDWHTTLVKLKKYYKMSKCSKCGGKLELISNIYKDEDKQVQEFHAISARMDRVNERFMPSETLAYRCKSCGGYDFRGMTYSEDTIRAFKGSSNTPLHCDNCGEATPHRKSRDGDRGRICTVCGLFNSQNGDRW